MTNYYHDAIPTNELADADKFNIRLGQLDSTVREFLFGRGMLQVRPSINHAQTLGAAGEITVTFGFYTLDTFGGAVSDNLDTVNLDSTLDVSTIRTVSVTLTNTNAARSIVVRHNVGNIFLSSAANITLDDTKKTLTLFYNSSTLKWSDVGQAAQPDNPYPLVPWTMIGADAAIDISNISQAYSHLLFEATLIRPVGAAVNLGIRLNNDSGSNYKTLQCVYGNAGASSNQFVSTTNFRTTWRTQGVYRTSVRFVIYNYTAVKPIFIQGVSSGYDSVSPVYFDCRFGGAWLKPASAAVTRLQVLDLNVSTVAAGSIYALYGLK